ncbi:MAG: hypothetical protein AAGI14_03825 [Pseudomonadota bacterium]
MNFAPIAPRDVVTQINKTYSELPYKASVDEPLADARSTSFLIKYGSVDVSVMMIDQRLPRETYSEVLALNQMWPQANEAFERHTTHYIVAALKDTNSHSTAIDAALAVTCISLVLADMRSALGFLFTEAKTVLPINVIRSATIDIPTTKRLPAEVWSQSLLFGNDRGKIGVSTIGLAPFIGRELELAPCFANPTEAVQIANAIIHYLLMKGPIIKNAEELKLHNGLTFRASFVDKGLRGEMPMLLMEAL